MIQPVYKALARMLRMCLSERILPLRYQSGASSGIIAAEGYQNHINVPQMRLVFWVLDS